MSKREIREKIKKDKESSLFSIFPLLLLFILSRSLSNVFFRLSIFRNLFYEWLVAWVPLRYLRLLRETLSEKIVSRRVRSERRGKSLCPIEWYETVDGPNQRTNLCADR